MGYSSNEPTTIISTDNPTLSAQVALAVKFLPSDSTSDHTAIINTALAAAPAYGLIKTVKLFGNFKISSPVIIPSNTKLDATDATITLIAGSNKNLLQSSAVAPLRSASFTTTAASTTVTADAGMSSSDIGRSVVIPGAGPNGVGFTAVITAVASATSFTISKGAGASVTAVTGTIHIRNTNITVIGGTWNRGTSDGVNNDRMNFFLRRVDGLRIDGVTITSSAGKYAINIADCNDFWVTNPYFQVSSDGVHIIGPATGGHISGVRGTLGDDAVSLTAVDFGTYNDVNGDIVGLEIESIVASTPTTSLVKFTSAPGVLVDKVHARGLTQLSVLRPAFAFANDTGDVTMGDITISDVTGRGYINAGTVKSLTLNNWTWEATGAGNLGLDVYASIGTFRVNGFNGRHGSYDTASAIMLRTGANITTMQMTNADFEGTGLNAQLIEFANGTGTVGTLEMSNIRRKGPSGNSSVVSVKFSTNALSTLILSNIVTDGTAWVADLITTTNLIYAGIRTLTGGSFNVRAGASVTVNGHGMIANLPPAISVGTVRSKTLDFSCDLSMLTKTLNDMATNNNASLSCGTGPVICGTSPLTWKHLYSGATY